MANERILIMKDQITLVKTAMLAAQRFAWEQGVAAEAVYESGDIGTAVAMAHDAVLRQQPDGRLGVVGDNIAVTDPACVGEVVLRAYEITGDPLYKTAVEKAFAFLMNYAPRTPEGIIFHNQISFDAAYSPDQIWSDSCYMAPPFLAAMGEVRYASELIKGYMRYLKDDRTGLLFHIYDAEQGRFLRRKLWATGNGWTLMGIGRVIDLADNKTIRNRKNEVFADVRDEMIGIGTALLDAMLRYQLPDGRFHDILDESAAFTDGAAAMMMAAFIYRGCTNGWLDRQYLANADLVAETMEKYVDAYGIIHEVCGCPDFVKQGTSVESMAAYIMMHAWRRKDAARAKEAWGNTPAYQEYEKKSAGRSRIYRRRHK